MAIGWTSRQEPRARNPHHHRLRPSEQDDARRGMRAARSTRVRFPARGDVGRAVWWVFARVDRSGWPLWDGLNHPHAVTYAALAFPLTEPLLPSGEAGFWARPALGWLDDAAWDDHDGGYWGSYRRDNERYAARARWRRWSAPTKSSQIGPVLVFHLILGGRTFRILQILCHIRPYAAKIEISIVSAI